MALIGLACFLLVGISFSFASIDKNTLEVVPIEKWGDPSMFYEYILENYPLVFTAFEDFECDEACRVLNFGEENEFNDICIDECTMYKIRYEEDFIDGNEEFEDQTEEQETNEGQIDDQAEENP